MIILITVIHSDRLIKSVFILIADSIFYPPIPSVLSWLQQLYCDDSSLLLTTRRLQIPCGACSQH